MLQNIIEYAYIEKHNLIDENIPVYNSEPNSHFAVLKMKTKPKENPESEPIDPVYIHFTIDYSGSMCEYSKNRNTKLDIVLHTVKSIVQFLSEKCWGKTERTISFGIDSFNHQYNELFPKMSIPKDDEELGDFEKMLSKKDRAVGNTNIELALKESSKKLNEYRAENPTHKLLHFFLTDGEPTSGETSAILLSKLTNPHVPTVYMGYGSEHNSKLLKCLSNHSALGSCYEYIHDFEKVIDVCGEVLHKYLYSALNAFSMICHGCRIYDSETHQWVTELKHGIVSSDQELIYSVIFDTEDIDSDTLIHIDLLEHDMKIEVAQLLYSFIDLSSNIVLYNDLSVYIFRQQVIELLEKIGDIDDIYFSEIEKFRLSMNALFRNIRNYIKTNRCNESNKKLLNVLCDDLYISYMTLGTDLGQTYSISRQSTHTRQTSYRIHLDLDEVTQNYNYDLKPISAIRRSVTQSYSQIPDSEIPDSDLDLDSQIPNLDLDLISSVGLERNAYTLPIRYDENNIENYNYEATQDVLYSPNVQRTIRDLKRER